MMIDRSSGWWVVLGALLVSGCDRGTSGDARLEIVSPWTSAECVRVEREFGRWRESQGRGPIRIGWISVESGDALERALTRRTFGAPVDVALGGAESTYERLAR